MTTILKGDTSAEISVVIAEGYDYSGATVEIEYQGATRRFTGVSAGETVKYTLKAEETAVMALGAFPVHARVLGADGSVVTVSNKGAKIRVTDVPQEVHSEGVIAVDIRGGLYGISDLPARYTDKDIVAKIREILRKGGAVLCAALALSAFSASVTKTNKEDVYNDQGVVTDVDLSGLATEGFVNGKVNDVRTQAQTNAALIAENSAKIDAATTLTPVYSDTPAWCWVAHGLPDGATMAEMRFYGTWEMRLEGEDYWHSSSEYDEDAQSVAWLHFVVDDTDHQGVSAVRVRTDVIGYALGGDTNRILSAQAAVAELYSALTNALAGKIAKDGEHRTQTLNGYLDIFGVLPDEESILRVGNSADSYWVGLSRETINRRVYSNFYTYRLPSSSGTLALASDIPTVADWAKAANKPTYTAAEVGAIPTTGGVFNASLHLNQKLSVGTWTSSVKPYDISGGSGIAFVFGDNVHTKQSNTMTLGVGALNTNAWSFIWNGDADRMYMPGFPAMSNPYATRYNGGFHVNPSVRTGMVNPLQNFWIGDTNLNDWIATLAPPTDLSGVVSKSGDTMRGDLELAGGSLSFRPSSGLLGGTCVTFSASGIETSTGGLSLGKFTYPDASGQLAIVSDIPTNAADIGALPISGGTMTGNLEIGYNSLFQINGGGNAKFQFSWGSALDNLIIKAYKETSGSYNIRFPTSEGLLALTSDIPTSMAWDAITSKPTFATVATSGAYSDLSGTPTLAAVATSGAYSDLSGKPTIPTVNNTTITLKQGENVLGTFTVNSATNATITIPPADTAAFEARMQVLESRAYIAIEGDAIYLVDPTENQ